MRLKRAAEAIIVAISYIATAKLGFLFAIQPGNVTTIWPPSGIALAAVLLLGNRIWLGIWLGSFTANLWLLSNMPSPSLVRLIIMSSFIGVGSILQALAGAYLIQHFTGSRNPFQQVKDVFKFGFIEAFSCMVAPSFGVTSLHLAGLVAATTHRHSWLTWWIGNLIGVMAISPLIVIWSKERWHIQKRRQLLELPLFLALQILVCMGAYGTYFYRVISIDYPLQYLPIALLIWAAFRYGRRGVLLSIIATTAVTIVETSNGYGPFAMMPTPYSFLSLQSFVGIITMAGLVLATAIHEEIKTKGLLEEALESLERLVAERTSELVVTYSDLEKKVAKLKISEDKFHKFLQLAPDAIIIVNQNGEMVTVNAQAEKIFGYKQDELLGHMVEMLIPEASVDKYKAYRENYTTKPVTRPMGAGLMNLQGLRKNGDIFPVEITLSPIETKEGIVIASIIRDVTQRKKLENERNRLFDLSPDLIAIAGFDGYRKYVNPAHEKVLGYTTEELLTVPYISIIHPEDRELAKDTLKKLLQGAGFNDIEYRMICKDGTCKTFLGSAKAAPEEGLFYVISRDITQRKKLEEERLKLNTYLLQSQKMISIGQLSAGVAHEINNPTGYILSNINTMEKYFDSLHSLLTAMSKGLERVSSGEKPRVVIKEIEKFKSGFDYDFLIDDFAKALKESEEGAIKIRDIVKNLGRFTHPGKKKSAPCNINEELQSALRICWNELKYKADVKYTPGELPTFNGYPQRLSQLFVILLMNAVQAIESKGEINISTDMENDEAVVRIRDTGCGIPPQHMNSLFEPFFTTKPIGKGAGLGLYVAYQIVEAHKGKIEVQSEVGKGTEFIIRFPTDNVSQK